MNYAQASVHELPEGHTLVVVPAIEIAAGDRLWVDIGEGWWGPTVRSAWSDGSDIVHYGTVNGGTGHLTARTAPVLVARADVATAVELAAA